MNKFEKFSFIKSVKGGDSDKKIYYFVASSEVEPDRDGDIVVVDGIDVDNFKKNPVILFAHNYGSLPVGKAVDIKKDGEELIIGVEFADTEEGRKTEYLVSSGYMKAVSIGFIPKEIYSDVWYGAKKKSDLPTDYPEWYEKNKDKVLMADTIIFKSELLELSVVPVPANQNALLVMRSKGIDNICSFTINENNKTITVSIPIKEVSNLKAVVPFSHPEGTVEDAESSWDKTTAVKSLRKWASSDGSGDKDTIDWVKYRKGFAWYDAENIDNLGSYKYPHHLVNDDGEFVTVWRGVASAMAYFMAHKENLPESDRKGVYEHLAKHYGEFEKEAPEYKDYTVAEAIKEFDDDTLVEYLAEIGIDKLLSELKELAKENDELKGGIEDVSQVNERLVEQLKEIEELIEKVENLEKENKELKEQLNKDENISSSPSEKEVDAEDDDVEYIVVDMDDVKKTIEKLFEKLN